jgi:hypothetical protein
MVRKDLNNPPTAVGGIFPLFVQTVRETANTEQTLLNGAINMTTDVPANLDQVYALMRQRALGINQ